MANSRFRIPVVSEQHLLDHVRFRPLAPGDTAERGVFREIMEKHRYFKSDTLVGGQLRYVAEVDGRQVALLSWSAAANHLKDREQRLGWNISQANPPDMSPAPSRWKKRATNGAERHGQERTRRAPAGMRVKEWPEAEARSEKTTSAKLVAALCKESVRGTPSYSDPASAMDETGRNSPKTGDRPTHEQSLPGNGQSRS